MAAGLLPWLLWSGVRSRNTEQSPQRAPTRAPVVCTEQGLLSGRPVSASVAWARAMQGPSTSQQRLCWAGGPHLGLAPTPAALAVLGRWPSPGPGPPVAFAVRGRLPSPGHANAGQAALTQAWPLLRHSRCGAGCPHLGLAMLGRPPSPGPGPSRCTHGCIYSALLPTQRLGGDRAFQHHPSPAPQPCTPLPPPPPRARLLPCAIWCCSQPHRHAFVHSISKPLCSICSVDKTPCLPPGSSQHSKRNRSLFCLGLPVRARRGHPVVPTALSKTSQAF